MNIYPAIDLKDGACVRLLRGDMDQATVFNIDPAEQAQRFEDQGFRWLHLVDLNGAFAGHPVNGAVVDTIVRSVDIPVQLGGGIRSMETLEHWLCGGVQRVILGTVALRNPELVTEACARFPGRVLVGIDAREGMVAVSGWAETSEVKALDLALRYEASGVAAIVYTDINRDGAMGGLNVDATADLAMHLTTPVIASGGVSSLADLEHLKREAHTGIDGVIIGRALYDGRIEPAAALGLMGS